MTKLRNRLPFPRAWLAIAAFFLPTFAIPLPAAHALPPVRVESPLAPLTLSGICPFDVLVEPLANRNNQKVTTFYDQNGNPRLSLVTGTLAVRLTNADSGKSIVVNIPGPGKYLDGGQSAVFEGPWVIFLPPNTVPGSPALLYIRGRINMTFDASGNTTSIRWQGQVQDLCAALAAP